MKIALLLLSLAGRAGAQALPGAVVWLPPESFRAWSGVDALMRASDGLKLTIGVTPAMATPLVKAALTPWIAQGRVELAARIDGDPVLTMVAGHPEAPRPQDAVERAVDARERLLKKLGLAPAGFIPGAGAVDEGVAAALGASGAGWILAGPYALPDAPWVAGGRAVLVPSSAVSLFDESASTGSVFLAAAGELPRPVQGWATVGELAAAKTEAPLEPAAVEFWPAWNPEAAAFPPADEGAKAAWDAYGAAAHAVGRYQNSGSADLRTLDAVVDLLRRAQAARHYRPEGADDAPPALKAALIAVYKRMKRSPPRSLYGSAAAAGSHAPSERSTGVQGSSGPSWLEFRAPFGTIALAADPPSASTAPAAIVDGGAAADPWRLRSLRAEWNDEGVRLTLRVGRATMAAPRPVYEIYTDLNRVLGAGRVPMLEGRGAIVMARDAWEFALSISGEDARLFRASGGEPDEIASFKAQWKSDRGEVSIVVPRAYMRGNPARWGWAVVALAEDPARPGRSPAASLVSPDGTILRGVLAPAELQKAILSRANARVPAARLEN